MAVRQSKNLDIRQSRNIVLQQNNVKYIIKQSQQYLLELSENLSSFEPFNNTVVPDDCVDRLVTHRLKSKFHIDDPSHSDRLQKEAFTKYVDYDDQLSDSLDIWSSLDLRRARVLLHTWFRGFSVDMSAIRYTVTPGETFISSGGEVSILAKLFDKNHWTTTANCLDDTCVFIYNNASFKRAARRHIGAVTRRYRRKLYLRYQHEADVGYHIFKHLLIERVLILVDGARASSVPKSNAQRRFINVEAMFPVILQRAGASEILRVLKRHGNDLGNTSHLIKDVRGHKNIEQSAQALHGQMISDSRYSTIDFSNASDSVTVAAVCGLFPKQVSDYLIRTRSHFVVIDNDFHEPKKLSSMGNGFTFEVMTAMLYAIASVMTSDCRVYGDDVILPSEFADRFVRTCELVDFRVNESKTFINKFFRESCGYFYSDHIGEYITSFDFNQIVNLSDVIITVNKLTVILEAGQISHSLWYIFERTRDLINALIHSSRKGPLPRTLTEQRKYLALYVFDVGYRKKQSRCKDLRSLRKHYIERNAWYFDSIQVSRHEYALVYVPFFVPSRSSHVFANTDGLGVLLPALYSGKRLNAVIKGKGRWVDLPAFVAGDGTLTLLSNLIFHSRGIWRDRLDGVVLAHQQK